MPFGEHGIDPSPPLLLELPLPPDDESGMVKTSGNAMSSAASLGPLLLPEPLLLALPLLPPELEPPLLPPEAPELPPEAPLLLDAPSPVSPPSGAKPPLVPLPPPQAATMAARLAAGQAQESQVRTKLWWHPPLRNQRKDAM